jgi:2'-5' RNA ligase
MRLFIGLRLPEETLDVLERWQAATLGDEDGRLVPRENLHITVAFLGDREPPEVARILEALEVASRQSLRPTLTAEYYEQTSRLGMVVLQDDVRRRAFGLRYELRKELEAQELIEEWEPEWLPHITAIRIRAGARRKTRHRSFRLPAPQLGAFAPSDAAAFLSRLHPSGASYEVLESFPLNT